jgi:hypothetical protein
LFQHSAHIVDCNLLAIGADGLEKELDVVWVLHVGLSLDQYLVLQDVIRGEDSLQVPLPEVDSLSDALEEDLQLGGFILETESSVAIDHLVHLQLCLLLILVVDFHYVKGVEVVGVREIFESFFKLFTPPVPSSLDNSGLKFLAEALEVPWIVVE